MRNVKWRRLLAAGAALAVAAASAHAGGLLPFQPVAKSSGMGAVGPNRPAVSVAWTLRAAERVAQRLRPEDAEKVRAIDFRSRFAVAAFAGRCPTGGYGITVRRLSVRAKTLRVVVTLRRPRPGEVNVQALTRPYHVVAVRKDAVGARPPRAWLLVDATGRVLSRSGRQATAGPCRSPASR